MIKFTVENGKSELKAWVDPGDGSLNFSIDGKQISMDESIGRELLGNLKAKQGHFSESKELSNSKVKRFFAWANYELFGKPVYE